MHMFMYILHTYIKSINIIIMKRTFSKKKKTFKFNFNQFRNKSLIQYLNLLKFTYPKHIYLHINVYFRYSLYS